MYEYNDYVKAHNILTSILKKYEAGDVDINTREGILDNIRKQNIIRSIFDCIYLIDIETDAIKQKEQDNQKGQNILCLYIYDIKYINNRKIECYEKLTKEQVIEKLSDGIANNNLLEFELNNKKFTTATAELKSEDFR